MTKRKGKDKQKAGLQALPQLPEIVAPAGQKRDLRIDAIRGLLLIVMVIDHSHSYIANFTYKAFGYVSVAEGFIFLSAFVFAMIYVRQAGNIQRLTMVGLKKAYLIYRYHITLILILPLLAFAIPLFRETWQSMLGINFYRQPLATMFQEVFLIHQPPIMDILPMYCVFVLISPVILVGFHRGWTIQIFAISFALWFLGQHINPMEWLSGLFPGSKPGFFNWIAWQIIWVGGIYLGFINYTGRIMPFFIKNRLLMIVCLFVTIVLFLNRHEWINIGFNAEFAAWRPDVGWLRLLNFGAIVVLVSYLLSYIPQNRGIPWVSFIGRYSLQVFSYHVLLIFLFAPLSVYLLKSGQQLIHTLITIGLIISLTIPALIKNSLELRKKSTSTSQIPV